MSLHAEEMKMILYSSAVLGKTFVAIKRFAVKRYIEVMILVGCSTPIGGGVPLSLRRLITRQWMVTSTHIS